MAATIAEKPSAAKSEREDEAPPRVVEDEEADVEPELGIGDAERCGVAPGQVGLDLAGGGPAGEQPDQDAEPDHDPDRPGLDQLAVAVEQLTAAAGGPQPRAQPVGDGGVGDHDGGHDQPEGREQTDPRQQHGREHGPEVDGVEPEPVGPEVDEDGEGDHQNGDDDQRGQDRAAPSADPKGTHSGLLLSFCSASRPRRHRCRAAVEPRSDRDAVRSAYARTPKTTDFRPVMTTIRVSLENPGPGDMPRGVTVSGSWEFRRTDPTAPPRPRRRSPRPRWRP